MASKGKIIFSSDDPSDAIWRDGTNAIANLVVAATRPAIDANGRIGRLK
jgi:hypothetical protein